jgi:hypothetical protein
LDGAATLPTNSHIRDDAVAGRICFFATGMNYLLDLWKW